MIAEVHCVSRVYHGIEWPPLRGHEGYQSPLGIAQRFTSAEKHVHMVLAVEARESSNTQDKLSVSWTKSSVFEDMTATYLMPDIAGESAGGCSNIQWAFRQLRRKRSVDHTGATSGCVYEEMLSH